VIATRDFKSKGTCPMLAFGGEATSYADNDEIKAWLREQRTLTEAAK
jgi:hypothetical protein